MPFKRRPRFVFQNQGGRITPLVCEPRSYLRVRRADGRTLWAACLAWAMGPLELAVTGDGRYNTLFGSTWLVQICADGSWVLYQKNEDHTLEVIAWDVVPPMADISARHPTLCFDQAARPVIAWEDDTGIFLREFDEFAGQYQFIGPLAGCDPVLVNDSTINYHVPGSDVVLFYLSADRTKLMYRIQNENFNTEHEHYDFGAEVIMDGHDVGSWRFQLRYSDSYGSIIGPANDGFTVLLSDIYPIYIREQLIATVSLYPEGELRNIMLKDLATGELDANVGPLLESELRPVMLYEYGDDAMTGNVDVYGASELRYVMIYYEPDEAITGTVLMLPTGELLRVTIRREENPESMFGVVGALEDGAYVAA